MASGLLLGFVSSRNDSHSYQIAYICLLIVNIGIVEIYEVAACSQIITTILPQLKHVLFAIGILNISLNIGLCICNKDLPSILVILLCSSCILYSVVSFSYLKLLSLSRSPTRISWEVASCVF
ncbi:hypothetical protein B0O99DRAFT_62625 [Bisporella sp. PMI_857]|nr:hypothetical protein B0O99DRAFT_62625 [Bisporella sp. PMI_857]